MKQVPADEEYRQPLAFIGIGSSNESDMQQIMIEDKVRLHAGHYRHVLYVLCMCRMEVTCLPLLSFQKVIIAMTFAHTNKYIGFFLIKVYQWENNNIRPTLLQMWPSFLHSSQTLEPV